MHIEGRFTVSAARDRVWKFVSTLESIVQCVPGLAEYHVKSPQQMTAKVKFGVGFIKGSFNVNAKIIEESSEYYRAKLLLNGSGAASAFDSEVSVELEEREGSTLLAWRAEVRVSGPLGTISRVMLEDAAKKIVDQLFACVKERVSR